jgi:hypothetical protein
MSTFLEEEKVMNRTSLGRLSCVAALVVLALAIPYAASLAAPKSEAKSASAAKETKADGPRLPDYYARVVTDEQRPKLTAILQEFAPQIAEKRAELQALISKRDTALEKILTPDQRQEVEKLRAEAASKRQATGASAAGGKEKKAKSAKNKAKQST